MRKLLVLSLALALATPAMAQTEATSGHTKLVPTDATFVVHIPALDDLQVMIGQAAALFGQPEEMGPMLVGQALSDLPFASMIDRKQSIYLAVSMPTEGLQPNVTLVFPAKDASEIPDGMGVVSGNYAALSMTGGEVKTADTPCPLLAGINPKEIVARGNLGPAMENYGPMLVSFIELGSGQIPEEVLPPGMDIDSIIDAVIEFVENFTASADKMEMRFGFDGKMFDMGMRFDWKPDSPLANRANALSGTPTAVKMARMLPYDGHMSYASGYDLSGFMNMMGKMGPAMMEGMPPMFPEPLTKMMEQAYGMYEGQTGRGSFAMNIAAGDIKGAGVAEVKNAKSHLGKMNAMLEGLAGFVKEMGVGIDMKASMPEKGPSSITATLAITEALDEMVGEEGVSAMIKKLIGENFGMTMVAKDSFVASGVGHDVATLTTLMEGKGQVPAQLAAAFKLGGTHPMAGFTMDLGGLAKSITGMMKMAEAPMPLPDYANAPEARVWFGSGNAKNAFVMGLKVDLANIGAIAKAAMK